jgi:hypothetical protein
MRIAIAIGLAALAAGSLTSCYDAGSGTAVNTNPAPGTLIENPPPRLASLNVTDLTAQFSATAQGQQLLQLAGNPVCGVDFHYIQYETVGGAGEVATASGALMIPTGTASVCHGPRPIVLYAHGTATSKTFNIANITDSTNAGWGESALIAAIFAAQGYIVVAPNYAGYDTSTLPYHPFLNVAQQSSDMIDALIAARTGLPSTFAGASVSDGGKLVVTGYSEGGFVAAATHIEMEARGMRVDGSAPMSGPYAMEAMGDAVIFGSVNIGSTVFLPLITTSYQHAYGNVYTQPSDVYSATFATGIDTLLPSTQSLTDLFGSGALPQLALFACDPVSTGTSPVDMAVDAILTATIPGGCSPTESAAVAATGFGSPFLINNATRGDYAKDAWASPDGALPALPGDSSPTYPPAFAGAPATNPMFGLRTDLRANDLRMQPAPVAPLQLCGGHNDPTVFYSVNTVLIEGFWAAALQNVVDVDPSAATTPAAFDLLVANAAGTAVVTSGSTDPATIAAAVGAGVLAALPPTANPGTNLGLYKAQLGFATATAGVAAAAAATDLAGGIVDAPTIGADAGAAAVQNYHGTIVPPFCTAAAKAFLDLLP